jgi:hypothetical protein
VHAPNQSCSLTVKRRLTKLFSLTVCTFSGSILPWFSDAATDIHNSHALWGLFCCCVECLCKRRSKEALKSEGEEDRVIKWAASQNSFLYETSEMLRRVEQLSLNKVALSLLALFSVLRRWG